MLADFPRHSESPSNPLKLFFSLPLYAPLLFPNETSDARDHAAAERTLLSYLRLAVYMAVVSVAIVVDYHLKGTATSLEQHISYPVGLTFFVLSLLCLGAGYANYLRTVAGYAKRRALVQSGMKTQIVFMVVAVAIVATCGLFLAAEAQSNSARSPRPKSHEAGSRALIVGAVGESVGVTPEEALLRLLAEAAGRDWLT